MTGPIRLVTVAHGTRHAAGNEVAVAVTQQVRRRLGVPTRHAYVELAEPLLDDVLDKENAGPRTVVLPLLLSVGHHLRSDLPRRVGSRALLGPALGPHPLLAEAMADRLCAAGAARGTPVVLVAAGSSDPSATRDQRRAADHLAEVWGAEVAVATLSGRGDRLADLPREWIQGRPVAPYLLAPGHFAERCRAKATEAGAGPVADVIGAHPAVAEVAARRFAETLTVNAVDVTHVTLLDAREQRPQTRTVVRRRESHPCHPTPPGPPFVEAHASAWPPGQRPPPWP